MTFVLRQLRPTTSRSQSRIRCIHSTSCRRQHFLDADTKVRNQTFDDAISKNSKEKVVLVDFYANWCNPCKLLSPILEKLTSDPEVKSGSGRSLDLVTVDTDAQFDLGQKFKIRSLPTVIAFRDGKAIDQFIGALNETGVRAFLAKV